MPHTIRFSLDGEPETTDQHELTPNQIIADFGGKDSDAFYLVRVEGNHRVSFQDKGDEPIKLHNNLRLITISLGPTPVSDMVQTGTACFVSGLAELGYDVEVLDASAGRIIFDYAVETGRHAGKTYRQGLEVPADFPMTPPGGPHVSPHVHPISQGRDSGHPTSNIHASPNFGANWQYWSRPFPDWANSRKTVATYMAHIWRLWDSQ